MRNYRQNYYSGPERRLASHPRRVNAHRRHRVRIESLVSDCRKWHCRREEDEDGFVELANLYTEEESSQTHPHTEK